MIPFVIFLCALISSTTAAVLRDGVVEVDEAQVDEGFAPTFDACEANTSAQYLETCSDICGPDSCQHSNFDKEDVALSDFCLCDNDPEQVPGYECSETSLNETFSEACDITCASVFSEEASSYTSLYCSTGSGSESRERCICIPYEEEELENSGAETDVAEDRKEKPKKNKKPKIPTIKKKKKKKPGQNTGNNIVAVGSGGNANGCNCNRQARKGLFKAIISSGIGDTGKDNLSDGSHVEISCNKRACLNASPGAMHTGTGTPSASVGGPSSDDQNPAVVGPSIPSPLG